MKKLIVFYSRTGTTKKAAETLAKEIDAEIEEIKDKDKREGATGYLRSGYQAMTRKLAEIEKEEKNPNDYDLVIIGTPVWAGKIPPAIRTYLTRNKLEKKIGALITMGGRGDLGTLEEIKKLTLKAEFIGWVSTTKKDMELKIKEFSEKLNLIDS